nr:probable alpha,alpha-trehalose-phosphate synthase [UDP-forming] 7 [Tanacetum cinerariifolium]
MWNGKHVTRYQDADPGFGFARVNEILDHLESVLANEPVKSAKYIVEVKPQEASKGLVAEKIFTSMAVNRKQADFVLCIDDDRSDEDMFEIIGNAILGNMLSVNTNVFACTEAPQSQILHGRGIIFYCSKTLLKLPLSCHI